MKFGLVVLTSFLVVSYALGQWFGDADIESEILGFDGVRLNQYSSSIVGNGKPGIGIVQKNSPWREGQTLEWRKTRTNYKSRANPTPIGSANNENMRPKKTPRNLGRKIRNQKLQKKPKAFLAAPVVEKVSKLSPWNHQPIIEAATYQGLQIPASYQCTNKPRVFLDCWAKPEASPTPGQQASLNPTNDRNSDGERWYCGLWGNMRGLCIKTNASGEFLDRMSLTLKIAHDYGCIYDKGDKSKLRQVDYKKFTIKDCKAGGLSEYSDTICQNAKCDQTSERYYNPNEFLCAPD
jgi:hypothetical protein